MTDRLVIRNLQVPTLIGVYDFERTAQQTLRLDITLYTDTRQAGRTDDLQYTLNYADVASKAVTFGAQATYQLLEAFAAALCAELLAHYALPQVDLAIYKDGCIPGAQGAELHISRRCTDGKD